jgi:predicted molibdopterin-dependent oxidoreductase YjgC
VRNHPDHAGLVHLLVNLTILTGNAARDDGGLNILLPEVNSHGAADMGVLPDGLPGHAPIGDAEARRRIERMWEVNIPAEPGLNTHAMLEAAADGKMQVLYIVGEDVAQKYHDPELAQRALENAGFVVVQDLFLTETAQYADVVLPAASVAEKGGHLYQYRGTGATLLEGVQLPVAGSQARFEHLRGAGGLSGQADTRLLGGAGDGGNCEGRSRVRLLLL